MLHLGTHLRLSSVHGLVPFAQRTVAVRLLVNEVFCTGRVLAEDLTLSGVRRITPHPGFVAVQQIGQHLTVVHIRGRHGNGMNELGLAVHANVAFHAEVPLIAFFGLVHVRIAFLLLVLGRTGRADDRGIDDRTAADLETAFLQVRVHALKQRLTQRMLFQAGDETCRPWSRPAPLHDPNQPQQTCAGPGNRTALLPRPGPTG